MNRRHVALSWPESRFVTHEPQHHDMVHTWNPITNRRTIHALPSLLYPKRYWNTSLFRETFYGDFHRPPALCPPVFGSHAAAPFTHVESSAPPSLAFFFNSFPSHLLALHLFLLAFNHFPALHLVSLGIDFSPFADCSFSACTLPLTHVSSSFFFLADSSSCTSWRPAHPIGARH